MTKKAVLKGAIFHYSSRRRREVIFTEELRRRVGEITVAVREMLSRTILPSPANDERCHNCSLAGSCMPELVKKREPLHRIYLELFEVND